METRVSLIGILVKNPESVDMVNAILHEYRNYIIGRMGIPYREKNVNLISVAMDAPLDTINKMSGKIGRLKDVTVKTIMTKE
ncbi:MAG: iron-only hydrogenase system regulator [Holdemanella sp.]|nr:iron-only hydrogenase system regulator [Holdemanella sp.]